MNEVCNNPRKVHQTRRQAKAFFFLCKEVHESWYFSLYPVCSGFPLEGAVPRYYEKGCSCSICSPARSRKYYKSHKRVCSASWADSEVNPSCVIAFNKNPVRLNHRIYETKEFQNALNKDQESI